MTPPEQTGTLIAFEGVDGSGKSTQVQRCVEWIRSRHGDVPPRVLREPGGTQLGESVRELLLARDGSMGARAEMLLYMAARAQLYDEVVDPALAAGETVLLDRSHYSTAAYQGAGLGVDAGQILRLADFVTGGRGPDRVVLLDLSPQAAAARLAARDLVGEGDRIERRDSAYFLRVAEGYRALARAEPERFVVVDAGQSEQEVAAAIRSALDDVV